MRRAMLRLFAKRLSYGAYAEIGSGYFNRFVEAVRPVRSPVPLIRVGGDTDGGYLVPEDFDGIEYCFSPGVDDVATFEESLSSRGIRSFLADYSVEAPPATLVDCDFLKKFLGVVDTESTIRLQHWMEQKVPVGHSNDLILQMDIEGGEYSVILDTPMDLLSRFRIIVLELHNLDRLFDPVMGPIIAGALEKLSQAFRVVHLHPNNYFPIFASKFGRVPPLLEITMLRKDRFQTVEAIAANPHPLDRPCVMEKPDVRVPEEWFDTAS